MGYTSREFDIMMLEAEEWVRTTMEKFALAYQGERAQQKLPTGEEQPEIGVQLEPSEGE